MLVVELAMIERLRERNADRQNGIDTFKSMSNSVGKSTLRGQGATGTAPLSPAM